MALVTGAGGQLGRALVARLGARATGALRREELDVADAAAVQHLFRVTASLDSLIVEETTRSAFERLDSQRSSALVAQLERELERRQEEVMRRTERIAASDVLQRMAVEEDYSAYLNEARTQADAQGLDFVELTARS